MSTNVTNTGYTTAFQAYLKDRKAHAAHTESGVFQKTQHIAQTAMNRTTVQDFMRKSFEVLTANDARCPLFRTPAAKADINNPQATLDPILVVARLKATFARSPELYLNPTPVQTGNVLEMATPLLLAMMSNDADGDDGTLNTGMQGDDERFSPAHIARFLSNLSTSCGGDSLVALLRLPEGQRIGQQPIPRATLVTALGFKYDQHTGELLISRDLFSQEKDLNKNISTLDRAINKLVLARTPVGDPKLTDLKNQRAILRKKLDIIAPELLRLKELSLHLRLTQVNNVIERIRALTPSYQKQVKQLQALQVTLLEEQQTVKIESLQQRILDLQRALYKPVITKIESIKISNALQITAKELTRRSSGNQHHNILLKSSLQQAKDLLITLDSSTDMRLANSVLLLLEFAVIPKSDAVLQREAIAWLHKNKVQLLAATPDRQKADLEAGFDRLFAYSAELEARSDRLSADSIGTRVAKVASFAIACAAFNPRLVTGKSATAVGLQLAALLGVSVLTTDQPRMVRFFDRAVQAGTKLVEAAKARFKKS